MSRRWSVPILAVVALAAPLGAWLSPAGSEMRLLFRLLAVLVGLGFGAVFAFMQFQLLDLAARRDPRRAWEVRAVGVLAPGHDDEPEVIHNAKGSAKALAPLYLLALVAAIATWFGLH